MKTCKICNSDITSKRGSIYCSNKCKFSDKEYNKSRVKKRNKFDGTKKIICNIDNKEFSDIDNRSGVLSRHLKSIGISYINVFDYYTIVENNQSELETWNCKYCDWKSKDIKNVSGWITTHLKNKHNITPTQHILKYPEDKKLWASSAVVTNKEVRELLFNENPESYIECLECGEKLKRMTITHLSTHNITIDEYRKKHNLENLPMCSLEFSNKMRDQYFENYDVLNKIIKISKHEKELCEFLDEYNIQYETSNRKIIYPQELDIYIPSKNIAIELNGLYWHSEKSGGKLKDYHISKTELCEKNGIRLIQIFDDEWIYKKNIVKAKLLSILSLQKEKVFARNCEIRVVGNKEKSEFLKKYHIQSDDKSKYVYGLFYKNDLVSIMTFCELRAALGHKKKEGHFELSRYASKIRVVGGASKLLKKFIKDHNPLKIITYADKRFTTTIKDSMYEKLGFIKIHNSKPNYWYTKDYKQKQHRYNFTKSAIVKKYGLDKSKTEFVLMDELGYDRIWDCGNIRYELSL